MVSCITCKKIITVEEMEFAIGAIMMIMQIGVDVIDFVA